MGVFRQAGFDHPRFLYSDYGIPVAALRRPRPPAPGVRFGYFSAVIPHKGIELLIRSFRQISGEDKHLLVQGQGNERYLSQVKALAGEDPRITFLPPYRETEVAEAFSRIDVLVVPSLWYENSPIVIHEAAAARVPVVASDIGGMAEYVRPGRNGLLFRFGDSQDLRRQMEMFLRDRGLSSRLTDIPFPIKTVEENVAELRGHYGRLVRGAGNSSSDRVR
jgi:glycosyltransferase involved in cell wall biosynthesis